MITYNGLDLFSSGPCQIDAGPLESRQAISDIPDAIGATVIGQGTQPRSLTQRGQLIAASQQDLQLLFEGIEVVVGQGQADLVEASSNTWKGCVLQRFDHEPIQRLGPRYTARYTATYLQLQP